MVSVSEVKTSAPETFRTPLHEAVYRTLGELEIPFERVDTGETATMEDCEAIDERLGMTTVKTLFLCNRQRTEFYLFITPGGKPFRTKDFSGALGVPRVSFGPEELMEPMLGTRIGAVTIFSCLFEPARDVRIVIDREVLASDSYGCTDGTTTGYMKIRTSDLTEKLLPHAGRTPEIIDV